MTTTFIDNRRVRSWVYGVVTLCSLVVFGNIAEVCDAFNACPVRLRGIITIGVMGTIFALVICLGLLFKIEPIIKLELVFVLILFILYSICVGLVSSVRTGLGNTIAVSFAWIAEVLLCIVFLMLLTSTDGPCPVGNGSKTPEEKMEEMEQGLADVETPEEEYMRKVGTPQTDSGNDSEQSPNGMIDDSKDMDVKNTGNA